MLVRRSRIISATTRAELDQLPRRGAEVGRSQTTPDFPLYPDRFAWRVTEAFGDTSSRYLEALSVSPERAAGRAVRELTDSGRLGEVKLPNWVVSSDPKTAKIKQEWLKTGEGKSGRADRRPEVPQGLGQSHHRFRRITSRLSAEKGLLREMTGKGPATDTRSPDAGAGCHGTIGTPPIPREVHPGPGRGAPISAPGLPDARISPDCGQKGELAAETDVRRYIMVWPIINAPNRPGRGQERSSTGERAGRSARFPVSGGALGDEAQVQRDPTSLGLHERLMQKPG